MSAPPAFTAPASAAQALDVRRPFTRAQGLAAGISAKRLRGPGFRSLHRGVLVASKVPDSPLLRARAVLALATGPAFVSHTTAARLVGVPLPDGDRCEHLTVQAERFRLERPGVRCHVLAEARLHTLDGVPLSASDQLFVELASVLGVLDLVVAGDHLVAAGRVSPERLIEYADAATRPGAKLARRAARLVRARVDSPMETRLRLLLVFAGFPEPQVNLTFAVGGQKARRFDLSYPEQRLIIEYDGRHHIEREEQWVADLERREQLDGDGWRIIVLTATDIYRRPEETLARVWAAAQARDVPGLPRRLSDDWRAHFPSRG